MTPLARALARRLPAHAVAPALGTIYALLLALTVALLGYQGNGPILYLDIGTEEPSE